MEYLQLAIDKNGDIASVYQVATGLACNCYCPDCHGQLVAKNKNKPSSSTLWPGQRIAHFSHYSGIECKSAPETMMHLLAKAVLKEIKEFRIPHIQKDDDILAESAVYKFDTVEIEKVREKEDLKIIPDAALTTKNGKTLFIEFHSTHKVDEHKKEQIKRLGISCIEVDLSNIEPLREGSPNMQNIKWLLVDADADIYKTWLFNSEEERLYKNLLRKKEQEQEADRISMQKIKEVERRIKQREDRALEKLERRKVNLIADYQKKGYQLLEIKFYRGRWNYEGFGDRRNNKYYIPGESCVFCPWTRNSGAKSEGCTACDYFVKYEKFPNISSEFVVCKFS